MADIKAVVQRVLGWSPDRVTVSDDGLTAYLPTGGRVHMDPETGRLYALRGRPVYESLRVGFNI